MTFKYKMRFVAFTWPNLCIFLLLGRNFVSGICKLKPKTYKKKLFFGLKTMFLPALTYRRGPARHYSSSLEWQRLSVALYGVYLPWSSYLTPFWIIFSPPTTFRLSQSGPTSVSETHWRNNCALRSGRRIWVTLLSVEEITGQGREDVIRVLDTKLNSQVDLQCQGLVSVQGCERLSVLFSLCGAPGHVCVTQFAWMTHIIELRKRTARSRLFGPVRSRSDFCNTCWSTADYISRLVR